MCVCVCVCVCVRAQEVGLERQKERRETVTSDLTCEVTPSDAVEMNSLQLQF